MNRNLIESVVAVIGATELQKQGFPDSVKEWGNSP